MMKSFDECKKAQEMVNAKRNLNLGDMYSLEKISQD